MGHASRLEVGWRRRKVGGLLTGERSGLEGLRRNVVAQGQACGKPHENLPKRGACGATDGAKNSASGRWLVDA